MNRGLKGEIRIHLLEDPRYVAGFDPMNRGLKARAFFQTSHGNSLQDLTR